MVLPDGVLLTKTRLHKIGVLLTKEDYTKFALSRIDVYETGSLLMAENPYYNLGILKFENIYRLKVSLFTYKFKNDKSNTPAVLLNILTPASEIQSYNTRYVANQNFFKPSVCSNYGISTFKFSAIKIWKSVPPELKNLPYMLFKKQ